jgi:hypothetical protein
MAVHLHYYRLGIRLVQLEDPRVYTIINHQGKLAIGVEPEAAGRAKYQPLG